MHQVSLKKNSILNVIKTISSIIFPLITFPYISRVLLPVNVGKINFGLSYVSYFSLIASLGITTYAIRECSAVRNNKNELSIKSSEIFSINICTTIIAYILLTLSLIIFRKLDEYRILIVIQSTSILFTTLGADWLNSAMEDFKYITLRTIFFQAVSLILMFLFVKEESDYLKYAAITVFSSSGANIANIFYRKKYCDVIFTKMMHWKRHFKPILFLFVMILAQTVFNNADITMLGLMKGDYEVGIYSTAYKIENIIAQVVSSLVWVVMPRMSLYFADYDYDKINLMLRKIFTFFMGLGIPSVVGVCMLAKEIVIIAGGVAFIQAEIPLIILMFAFAFSLLGGSFLGNIVLLSSKKEEEYMMICCISAAVNVVLNYILIPYFGASGAAFTTAASSALMMIMLIVKKDRNIKLDFIKQAIISPCIGAVAIIFYCLIIKVLIFDFVVKIIASIFGSVVIYSLILIVMKNEIYTEIKRFFIKRI